MPRGPGRPSLLEEGFDPQTNRWAPKSPVDRLLAAVRGGAYYAKAAEFAGIGYSTLKRWTARGRNLDEEGVDLDHATPEDRPFRAFWAEFKRVDAEVHVEIAAMWRSVIVEDRDWRAAERWLTKRDPEGWSDKQTVEMAGQVQVTEPSFAKRLLENHELRDKYLDLFDEAYRRPEDDGAE